jgi:hypothetical protein
MVEDKIKSWLRQARDRDDGRKRRFLSAAAEQSTAKKIELDLSTDYANLYICYCSLQELLRCN